MKYPFLLLKTDSDSARASSSASEQSNAISILSGISDDVIENQKLSVENYINRLMEEKSEEAEQIRSETIQTDYTNDFYILENIGYLQLSLLGCLVFYFILSLVYKFIKSFF